MSKAPFSAASSHCASPALIIVLWRHRLRLNGLQKPSGVRLIVVGPSELVVNEEQIDTIHHVEGPITARDQNHSALLQKVRELCASLANVPRAICVLERALQRQVAQIRAEMEMDGLTSDQFDQLVHRTSVRVICKRGGLQTLKCCSFGSVQGKPDAWVEHANSHVGSYPMFLRPVNVDQNCLHTLSVAWTAEELRSWIKARPQSSNFAEMDYLVEECLRDGLEFVAVASARTGLIGTFCSVDSHKSLFMSVRAQSCYAIEFLSAEQTRDELPGAESFVMQTLKSVFARSGTAVAPPVFIKGFYRGHNSITFLSGAYELRKKSLGALFSWANGGLPWEVLTVQILSDGLVDEAKKLQQQQQQQNNHHNNHNHHSALQNGSSISRTHSLPQQPNSSAHFALINFPNSEGVLLHQTAIALRPYSTSKMRLVWRVSEGEELLDTDGLDENVLQIFLSNPSRSELLRDISDLSRRVEIPIDKNSMACTERRVPICRRDLRAIANSPGSPFTSGNQLIRSCTTAD